MAVFEAAIWLQTGEVIEVRPVGLNRWSPGELSGALGFEIVKLHDDVTGRLGSAGSIVAALDAMFPRVKLGVLPSVVKPYHVEPRIIDPTRPDRIEVKRLVSVPDRVRRIGRVIEFAELDASSVREGDFTKDGDGPIRLRTEEVSRG